MISTSFEGFERLFRASILRSLHDFWIHFWNVKLPSNHSIECKSLQIIQKTNESIFRKFHNSFCSIKGILKSQCCKKWILWIQSVSNTRFMVTIFSIKLMDWEMLCSIMCGPQKAKFFILKKHSLILWTCKVSCKVWVKKRLTLMLKILQY